MKKSLLLGTCLVLLVILASVAHTASTDPTMPGSPPESFDGEKGSEEGGVEPTLPAAAFKIPDYCEGFRTLAEGESQLYVGQMIIPRTPLEGSYNVKVEEIISENEVRISVNGETDTFQVGVQKEIMGAVVEVVGIDYGYSSESAGNEGVAAVCLFELPKTKLRLTCTGCISNSSCFPIGTRIILESTPKFCDLSGEWSEQKETPDSCQNNYECSSNLCVRNQCVEKTLLELFVEWFMTVLRMLGLA